MIDSSKSFWIAIFSIMETYAWPGSVLAQSWLAGNWRSPGWMEVVGVYYSSKSFWWIAIFSIMETFMDGLAQSWLSPGSLEEAVPV